MPKSFSSVEQVQISVRLPPRTLSFVRKRAEELGSMADAVREAIEDAHTFYGVTERMIDALREDATSQKKGDREYIRDMMTERFEKLMMDKAKHGKR